MTKARTRQCHELMAPVMKAFLQTRQYVEVEGADEYRSLFGVLSYDLGTEEYFIPHGQREQYRFKLSHIFEIRIGTVHNKIVL